MNIVIRTNCNGTLGHLARCRHLGVALNALGFQTHFILDKTPEISIAWLNQLSWEALYEDDGTAFTSEESDALFFIAVLDKHEPVLVIVDDYRLAQVWEAAVGRVGCTLLAIDDLRRNHCVDLLLEPRPVEINDRRQFPDSCMLLQGTQYVLLDAAYTKTPEIRESQEFTIVLSLGGGGDLKILHDCMRILLDESHQGSVNTDSPGVVLKPVIGPLATNVSMIHSLAVQYPSQVFPVEQEDNLAAHFRMADLFVGAAGTSVYETAACDLPAITFSLAPNQFNKHCELEPLGHYFHINDFPSTKSGAMANLMKTLIEQYPRLQALRSNPVAEIDGCGAQRVASIIQCLLTNSTSEVCALSVPGFIVEEDDADLANSTEVDLPSSELPSSFCIRACEDRDINRYLDARNLEANRENMTSDRPIHRLDHYKWWFTTLRQSFCAENQGTEALYIWHEVVRSANMDVLVGGWFVANETLDIACVMSALQWQLALTDYKFPHVPWVAVIKKTNKFVYKMNERAGFKLAESGSVFHQAIREYFPDADPEEFFMVYRICPAAVNVSE